MTRLPLNIYALWDPEALIWVATSTDIGEFALQDTVLERLIDRIPGALEALAKANPRILGGLREVAFTFHAVRAGSATLNV